MGTVYVFFADGFEEIEAFTISSGVTVIISTFNPARLITSTEVKEAMIV